LSLNEKAALAYLRRGFSVIPVDGKVPLIKWQPYTERPPTEEEVSKWWQDYPNANVAIVTGEVSGIIVLDIDSKEAEEFIKNKKLPDTMTALTAKGRHLYFKHPGFHVQNMVRKLPGLDIRGDHGFVVAPPSTHPTGAQYRWEGTTSTLADAPKWLLENLEATPIEKQAERQIANLPSVLDGVPEGQRDDAIFRYACRLRAKNLERDEAERLVLEAAANCQPPFPEKEALLKLDQAWKYSPGMATSILGQFGNKVVVNGTDRTLQVAWPDKGLYADISGLKQHTDGTISGILEIKNATPGIPVVIHSKSLFNFSKPRGRSELIRNLNERLQGVEWAAIVDELCNKVTEWVSEGEGVINLSEIEAHEPEYLLFPLLLKNEPVVFFGERGSTKSYIALWVASVLSAGHSPKDERIFVKEKVNVLYLDYEQSEENMAWRLECLARGLDIKKPPIYYRRCSRPLNTDTDRLKKLIMDHDIGLIVIDSLGPACGGDLNSAQVALEFHNALRTLRTSSLIVAHTAKNQQGRRSIFGSVYFENLSRSIWEVRSDPVPGETTMSVGLAHRKCNFSKLESPIGFRITFEPQKTIIVPEDARTMAIMESEWSLVDRIIELAQNQESITPRSVATSLGININVARDKLASLVRQGKLEQTPQGTYVISDVEPVPF
jgi:hypothetical protein